MTKHKILLSLKKALTEFKFGKVSIALEHPIQEIHGDYATNVALQLARIPRKGNFLENIEWFWKNINRKNFAGYRVDLPIGRLGKNVVEMIGASESKVWLRSITFAKIRGWREKEGFTGHPEIDRRYFRSIPLVLVYPEHVVKRNKKRYLLIGRLQKQFTLVIEIDIQGKKNWLVSAFMTRERYLKKREKNCLQHKKKGIPAGTAVSPILASLDKLGSGGSRFSTLQDTRKFYSTLSTKSQVEILSYEEKRTPLELAREIVNHLPKLKEIERVEVKKPGFINFWLSKEYLISSAIQIAKEKDKFGKSKVYQGKKYLIEHTSPNTIKTLHVGHIRNNILGMTIHNILEFLGAEVNLDSINNDRGIHVMKANWAYLQYGRWDKPAVLRKPRGKWKDLLGNWNDSVKKSLKLHDTQWRTPKNSKMKSDHFVDQFYTLGVKAEERFKGVKEEMREMLRAWEEKNSKVRALWKNLRDWTFEGFLKTYQRLESHHDQQWFESDFYEEGKKTVLKGLAKGIFRKLPDGAILSNLKKYNLSDVIVLRADGTTMYHTQDLYLTQLKRKKFPSDLYIWDIGPEQSLYLKQLFAMCEQLGIGEREDYFHMPYGFVYLKGEGKMSSRKGNIVSVDWLIEEMIARARNIIENSETGQKLSERQKKEIAGVVGFGAIKYGFLKVSRERDINFDLKEAVSIEGDSGPYLQYTYARCKSVLRKAGSQYFITIVRKYVTLSEIGDEEMAILRTLYKFPEVVYEAGKNYSPNLICSFLFDLAQKYNLFYQKIPILNAKNAKTRNQRLVLTQATAQVLKNGLRLLGIKVLERM